MTRFGEIDTPTLKLRNYPQAILKSKSPTARPARSGAEFNMEPDDRMFEIGLAAADKIRARLEKAEITGSDVEKFLPLVYFFVRAYSAITLPSLSRCGSSTANHYRGALGVRGVVWCIPWTHRSQ